MNKTEEIERLTDEIMALGAQIELKRKKALDLVKGMTATERRGGKFVIDNTKVSPGSWRLFLDGPLLKNDGTPHARTRISCPIALMRLHPRASQ